MRYGILSLIFCLAMSITTTLSAQSQDTTSITLQEAIDIALENNYQLKQASNDLELSEKSIFSEYADFAPSISGSFSLGHSKGQQLVRQGNQQFFQDNITNSISGSVTANVPLFNGFDNIISLRISKADQLSAEESLQRAKENVIFNTASSFYKFC